MRLVVPPARMTWSSPFWMDQDKPVPCTTLSSATRAGPWKDRPLAQVRSGASSGMCSARPMRAAMSRTACPLDTPGG